MTPANGTSSTLRTSMARFFDQYFVAVALGPVLALVVFAGLIPSLIMLWLSFTDFSFNLPGHDGSFIGFAHYIRAIADDERFHSSLIVQFVFVAVTVPLEFALGLACSLILWRSNAIARYALPIIVIPLILAPVTVGMIWRLLLHGDYGPVGYYVSRLPFGPQSVLGSPTSAFCALVLIDVWQWTPFFAVVLLTAMRALPAAPHRAALIDGASPWVVFTTVTLPLLRPAATVAILIRGIDSFKEFDKIFVLTRGGPASATELVSMYVWTVSFDHGDLGYGSALTVLVSLVIYFGSAVVFSIARRNWKSR